MIINVHSGKSTTYHLERLEIFVREAFLWKEHLTAIFFFFFFNLEKAHNSTWNYGILKDLYDLGFRGRLIEFINFLWNRNFQVQIGNTLSDIQEQEVPLGSILSVILFCLKMNSIVMHSTFLLLSCYIFIFRCNLLLGLDFLKKKKKKI